MGHEPAKRATAASGFSSGILRIETSYLARGSRDTVTQYDASTGGNAKDQVKFGYDGWGNVTTLEQDVDGVICTVGIDPWTVSMTYVKAAATGTAQMLRMTEQSSPWFDSTNKVSYGYGTSGSINDWSSRVQSVSTGATTVAQYDYLGNAQLIGTELNQAATEVKHFGYAAGAHTYSQLDQFGRVITSDWFRIGVSARDRALVANSLAYDERSSLTMMSDEVHGLVVNGTFTSTHDTVYTRDDLGRLMKAESGALNSTSTAIVSGSTKRNEEWSLDAMGNWLNDKLDINGDGTITPMDGERSLDNLFNKQNEYTQRGSGKTNVAYNANGLVKTAILDGSPAELGYQYDAFGRMTGYFTNINTLSGQLAAYRYNGLGQRIMWQYDVDSASGLEADEQYYFVHDAKGRVVASMRHTGTGDVVTMQEAFVYHAAGVAGRGRSSLSESAILRDVDSGYKWATASDNVLNVRTFYVQNWKGDVTAVLDVEGKPLERVRYTAFGTPSAHPIADVDGNGVIEPADMTKFLNHQGGGANATVFATTDLNADGLFPDDADLIFFDEEYNRVGANSTFGMNRLSSLGNREGFGGYEWDVSANVWQAERRVLDSSSDMLIATGMSSARGNANQGPKAWAPPWAPPSRIVYSCGPGFLYDPFRDQCVKDESDEWRFQTESECFNAYSECIRDSNSDVNACWGRFLLCAGHGDYPFIPGHPERIRPLAIPGEPIPGWSGVGHCFFCFPDGSTTGWGPGGWHDNLPADKRYCTPYAQSWWNVDCVKIAIALQCGGSSSVCERFDPKDGYRYPGNDCNDACSCMRKAFMSCRPMIAHF